MLFAAARIDEVEVALRGGVDEDVVGVFADAGAAQVVAGAAELVDEVVKDRAGGSAGGVQVGACLLYTSDAADDPTLVVLGGGGGGV